MEGFFNGTYQTGERGCKRIKVVERTKRALFDCLLFLVGPLVGVRESFLFVAWTAVAKKNDALQRLGQIEPMAQCHQ